MKKWTRKHRALRASGAGFWQIVFQAVSLASISRMVAWTFMRFEINFTNAVAMVQLPGAGGIGFQLFMAGSFYFNLHEMGFDLCGRDHRHSLEFCSTKIKAKVNKRENDSETSGSRRKSMEKKRLFQILSRAQRNDVIRLGERIAAVSGDHRQKPEKSLQ
ncbi:MAG: PhnE/PtxC family ABC transporter permease [Ruminococcus sp.]